MKNKQIDTFIDCLAKLETLEFIGLAKILKVNLWNVKETKKKDNMRMRPFDLIIQDLLVAYNKENRTCRKEILQMLKNITENRKYYHSQNNN